MLSGALQTPRLLIRDDSASDADAFYCYMQHEQYWRDLPLDPPTAESVSAMVRAWLAAQDAEPRTEYGLAVTDKASGAVIGEAILRVRSPRWRQGEIGWGVSCDRTGQGIATEIGSAMLRFGFDALGLHRVYAQCRLENHASRRIMAKLGMQEEGVLRQNVLARGMWWSSVQCSILSDEFDPGAAST